MSKLAGHMSPSLQTGLATVDAHHTADADCQVNLDVTKADSMQGWDQDSVSCQTVKRTKAEIWWTVENGRFV